MNETVQQLEYIRSQLAWIKSKVELDNQLGLHDINKLGEDIFMYILNDVYNLNLQNANDILHDDFPSIDLVDEVNKKVIQVTSTKTLKKARDTVKKLKELKFHEIKYNTSDSLKNSISFFRKLNNYEEYKISFLYLHEKPNIKTKSWKEFLEKEDLTGSNFIGIDDIVKIVQANPAKCEMLYKTIQQRIDSISFKFNIDSYFESFEPHLTSITSTKFKDYESNFIDFIQSKSKVFEVYSVGGNGKSHLLKYFSSIETEYIPLIFTKQVNIEEDLKKLDSSKKYLFIFDDIDRFLDTPILINLLSYSLSKSNDKVKCVISYRTASKNIIETVFRKYSHIDKQELEIVWNPGECQEMIKFLAPNLEEQKVRQIVYQFNNNPYLITQALYGNIDNIKDFSKKIIDDTQIALNDFNLSDKEIYDLLFELSLLSPISKNNISKEYQQIINRLVDKKILRELSSKYRFNPDMLGDLYLANYIDENKDDFEQIIESNLTNFSDTVFTNLSYALVYNESDSLQNFIKKIIHRWIENKEYRNDYLALINKVVYFAPMESFIYLEQATKKLEVGKTNTHKTSGDSLPFVATFAPPNGDWTSDSDTINLESIEPIISKLIYAIKNNISCEELKIEHIIKYLTSDKVMSLEKPYYDNQTLDSILEKLVSPLDTRDFDVILKSLKIMEKWLDESSINNQKVFLLKKSINQLLSATFDTTIWEGIHFNIAHTSLNLGHKNVLEITEYGKNILLTMLENENSQVFLEALEITQNIGGYRLKDLDKEHQNFYTEIKKESLNKILKILLKQDNFSFYQLSKINEMSIKILRFEWLRDLETEALSILEYLPRTNEFIFYEMIRGADFLITSFDEFKKDYSLNKENKDFWFDSQTQRKHYNKFSKDELEIISKLANTFIEVKELEILLNKLDMTRGNAYETFEVLLNKWFKYKNDIFEKLAKSGLEKIDNQITKNVLNKLFLTKGLKKIVLEDINQEISDDDIKVYIDVIFTNVDSTNFDILKKIIKIISTKKSNEIQMFISIISRQIYFIIVDNHHLYYRFEPILLQFLEWQLKYKFKIESFITSYTLYDIAKKNDLIINEKFQEILKEIINDEQIFINEFELKPIYRILNYQLKECIENLYTKLTALQDNGNPKYIFTHYFDYDKITEVILLKSFISNYEDFNFLVNQVLQYYKAPIKFIGVDGNKYEDYINLDYFFKHTVQKEYIEKVFNSLYNDNRIDDIKLLYKIVPVNSTYLEIIVKNLNLLEDKIDDVQLMDYLR